MRQAAILRSNGDKGEPGMEPLLPLKPYGYRLMSGSRGRRHARVDQGGSRYKAAETGSRHVWFLTARTFAKGRAIHLYSFDHFGPSVEGDRDLEARQNPLQRPRQVAVVFCSAGRPHESYGPMAELCVRDGHNHRFFDPLQPAEGLLYLLGLDVLATGDEEVIPAAPDA